MFIIVSMKNETKYAYTVVTNIDNLCKVILADSIG